LHGFPDFWFGWRHQVPALVEAGYRVYVPDSRGVNESDAPEGVSLYGLDDLAADALAVIDHAGGGPVEVVGHDWGGGVAWWLATEFPERVERVVAVNAPHPVAMERRALRDPRQALRSTYFLAFQVPALPEFLLEAADWRLMETVLRHGSHDAFDDAELYDYRQAWARTGAGSLLAPYRAAVRSPPDPPDPHVAPPAAILWSQGDQALVPELADDTAALCEDPTVVRFTGTGHFLHREAPDAVNDLLVRFLDGEDLRDDRAGESDQAADSRPDATTGTDEEPAAPGERESASGGDEAASEFDFGDDADQDADESAGDGETRTAETE
jgi:pimeloyl-ACP methyl ester carboxylesterase